MTDFPPTTCKHDLSRSGARLALTRNPTTRSRTELPVGVVMGGALVEAIGFHATGIVYTVTGIVLMFLIAWRWHADLWCADTPANGR